MLKNIFFVSHFCLKIYMLFLWMTEETRYFNKDFTFNRDIEMIFPKFILAQDIQRKRLKFYGDLPCVIFYKFLESLQFLSR
jgi:hypothetical protein